MVLVILALIIGGIYRQSKTEQKKSEEQKEKQALSERSELPENKKAAAGKDDLTRIKGIGPKVAGVLKNGGITSFDSPASADPAEVKNALNKAGLQMMNPELTFVPSSRINVPITFRGGKMLSMTLLEETSTGAGSIWVPILVLGWFLLMTLVGWQASKRQNAGTESPAADIAHSDSNPSEFDRH